MSDAHQPNIAQTLAALSISEQKTLDIVFSEHPGLEAQFLNLASRKAIAFRETDAESLRAIIAEEKLFFEKVLNKAIGK